MESESGEAYTGLVWSGLEMEFNMCNPGLVCQSDQVVAT